MVSGSMGKNKYGGKYSNELGGSISRGAQLAGERFKNSMSVPNQHDNNAKLFGELSNSFGARPGDRPRGAWRNLASGLFMGLEHGQKSKSIEKNQEKLDKYDKVMNYLEEVNNSSIQQHQWYAKRENAKRELMPQVLAYMDNIDSLDPQSQRIMASDILNQYGSAIGEDFKLSSIDGSNPFLMTIQSDKGQQLFDLRSMFAGDEAIQQSIAMKMPEYQKRLQEERQNKQREFTFKQDNLDVKKFKEGIPGGKYGVKGENSNNPYGSVPLTTLKQGGGGRAILNSINSEINLAKDIPIILHQLDEAENIINKNPAIGTSWNNFVSKGSFSKGFMDKDLRHAYEKLEKIASRVEEAYVKAKGTAITDAERATIKKGLFDSTLQGKSSAYNINTIREELTIAAERGKFASEELAKGFASTSSSFDNYMNSKKQSSENNNEDNDLWNELGVPVQ